MDIKEEMYTFTTSLKWRKHYTIFIDFKLFQMLSKGKKGGVYKPRSCTTEWKEKLTTTDRSLQVLDVLGRDLLTHKKSNKYDGSTHSQTLFL